MSAKHTAGPWHRNIRAGGKYPTIYAGRNQHVAVALPQLDRNETEANIDLIAAAPELLALVEDIAGAEWCCSCEAESRHDEHEPHCLRATAQRLASKARGEES